MATSRAGRRLRRFLRGRRVESISAAPAELVVSLGRRDGVLLRAEPRPGGAALLRVGLERDCAAPATESLYPELCGRRIVRVRAGGERVELHFGDGSTLELRAVVNGDGCRMATVRRQRQPGHGSSLLDRGLGRLLEPRPPASRGPRPSAGTGTY